MSGRHKTAEQYREEGRQQVRRELLTHVNTVLDDRFLLKQVEDPEQAVQRTGEVIRQLQVQLKTRVEDQTAASHAIQQLRERLNFWESTFGGIAQAVTQLVSSGTKLVRGPEVDEADDSVEIVRFVGGDDKIVAIKEIRGVTGWGLHETKDVFDAVCAGQPKTIRRVDCMRGFRMPTPQEWRSRIIRLLIFHFEVR